MLNFLKAATCLVVVSLLSGCGALDPVNMLLSLHASTYDMAAEMTSPQMRNITLTSLRTADCPVLASLLLEYQKDLTKAQTKGDRTDIAVGEMNISVVKQIQAEKSCPAAKPLQAKTSPSVSKPAATQSSASNTVQGSLNITVDSVPPSFAKSLGIADLKGALVVEVKKGSTADKAGVKPLDVILEVNGQPTATPAEFDSIVSRMRPGYKAPLRVWRDGKTRNVSVVVSKNVQSAPAAVVAIAEPDTAPSMASPPLAMHGWLGIQYVMSALGVFEDIPPAVATSLGLAQTQGILIGGALPGGAADKAGLRTLDVIVALNGRQLENRKQLTDLLARLPGGTPVKLGIWRNRKLISAQVILDSQVSQLTLPPAAEGYCFAWINANAATKTGAVSFEFVVSTAAAAEDINPALGAQFRAYMIERGLGADVGGAAGYAVCRKTKEAILKAREDATTALKQSFTATGKDTLAVYWVPR